MNNINNFIRPEFSRYAIKQSNNSHIGIKIISNNEMTEGLFGQVILFIFEILPILENKNIDISSLNWDISTLNYGAIFPNILKYNADLVLEQKKMLVVELKNIRFLNTQYILGDDFNKLHKLFFKYFTIPDELMKIADDLDLQNFLGIHFRGTDKTIDNKMNTPITKNDFFIILNEYIKKNNIKNIFLASDENDIIEILKNKYPNIILKSSRDFKGNLFWKYNQDKQLNAKYAMIDMLCLSKCKEVLKVSSSLSSFAKIINPNLKIFRLNALKMFAPIPYFPDAYIPLLNKNPEYSKEYNNTIEKVQLNDWSKKYNKQFNNFYYKKR